MWGCYFHWMKVPKFLRDKIWEAYRPGQERLGDPSEAYLKVAREVNEWIRENHPIKEKKDEDQTE
jgi:hypothetical protein